MTPTLKRWAFLPLLVVLSLWLGYALTNSSIAWGTTLGVVLVLVIAPRWDRRRQRRRLS